MKNKPSKLGLKLNWHCLNRYFLVSYRISGLYILDKMDFCGIIQNKHGVGNLW